VEGPQVVVVRPEQGVLAEHLQSAAGAAGEDLVPDAHDRRGRPVAETKGDCRRVVDARVLEHGRGVRGDLPRFAGSGAEHPAEHVDVVD
jgi:hypothetical protein